MLFYILILLLSISLLIGGLTGETTETQNNFMGIAILMNIGFALIMDKLNEIKKAVK